MKCLYLLDSEEGHPSFQVREVLNLWLGLRLPSFFSNAERPVRQKVKMADPGTEMDRKKLEDGQMFIGK